MKVVAIFNRDGGTFRTADMDAVCEHAMQAFSSKGRQIECRPVAGADIEAALQEAADQSDCDVILAGGGDGTISAAAGIAWKSGKTLAVLPAGTMNLYARTLGVPLDIYAGLDALASAAPRNADIGTANGRPFVHQFSIGFHSRMIKRRELGLSKNRWSKLAASIRAFADVVWHPPAFVAEVDADGKRFEPLVSALSVANNQFGIGHLPYADSFDGGVLGLYWAGVLPPPRYLRLSADLMLGAWHTNEDMHYTTASRVVLSFPAKPARALAVIDGELVPLADRVEIAIRPGELKVLVPVVD